MAKIVNVEELERVSSAYLGGKEFVGKQVLVAIDGKVLRGALDDKQNGLIFWQPICLAKGSY